MRARLLLTALGACLAGCPAPPAAQRPTAARVRAPLPSSSAGAPSEVCGEAATLLREADQWLHSASANAGTREDDQRCAAIAARKAAALCPTMNERARALVGSYEESERVGEQYGLDVSPDERWILTTGHAGGRLWERTSTGLELLWRLNLDGYWALTDDGRLLGREARAGGSLIVIDLASHGVHPFAHVEGSGVSEGSLLLADKRSIRRVEWATLTPREIVTTPADIVIGADGPLRLLAGGLSVVAGDTLASFETGTILAQGQEFLGTSADQRRILACREGLATVFDVRTGQRIAQLGAPNSALCGYAKPALSPDGRYVVGLDIGGTPDRGSYMIVDIFDVATGKRTSVPDKARSFGTALGAVVRVENAAPPQVCVHLANMHWQRDLCPWTLDANGRIAARPPAPPSLSNRPVVKPPNVELDRARSPDGKTIAIATVEEHVPDGLSEPDFRHLRVLVMDAITGKVTGTHEVVTGKLQLPPSRDDSTRAPVRFLDATHVLLLVGLEGSSGYVLDLDSAAITPIEGELVPLRGRLARIGDSLVDLTTLRRYALTPDVESFRRARAYVACRTGASLP